MKGILIVDHGSQKAEANDMLLCMANLIQTMAGPDVVVSYAHMELAEPTIAQGFAN
jgi:sirohydrochlorin ferrochelatase